MKEFIKLSGFFAENFMSKHLKITTRAVANLKKDNPEKYEREAIGAMATRMGFSADEFFEQVYCVYNTSDEVIKANNISRLTKQLHTAINISDGSEELRKLTNLDSFCKFLNDSFYATSDIYGTMFENAIEFIPNFETYSIDVYTKNLLNRYFAPDDIRANFKIIEENGLERTKSEVYEDVRYCFKQYKMVPPTIYKNEITMNLILQEPEQPETKLVEFNTIVEDKLLRVQFEYSDDYYVCSTLCIDDIYYKRDSESIFNDDSNLPTAVYVMQKLTALLQSTELSELYGALTEKYVAPEKSPFDTNNKFSNYMRKLLSDKPEEEDRMKLFVVHYLPKTQDTLIAHILDCIAPGFFTGCIQMLTKNIDSGYNPEMVATPMFFKNATCKNEVDYSYTASISSKSEFHESQVIRSDFYKSL